MCGRSTSMSSIAVHLSFYTGSHWNLSTAVCLNWLAEPPKSSHFFAASPHWNCRPMVSTTSSFLCRCRGYKLRSSSAQSSRTGIHNLFLCHKHFCRSYEDYGNPSQNYVFKCIKLNMKDCKDKLKCLSKYF